MPWGGASAVSAWPLALKQAHIEPGEVGALEPEAEGARRLWASRPWGFMLCHRWWLLRLGRRWMSYRGDPPGPQCVGRAAVSERVEEAKEDGEIGPPREEAVHERTARSEDLRGDEHEALYEGAKLHAQDAIALGLVLLSPARHDW